MESFLFLSSILAVAVIVHWLLTNDGKGPNEKTEGLLAMRDAPRQAKPPPKPKIGAETGR